MRPLAQQRAKAIDGMLRAYRSPWWLRSDYNASVLVARFSERDHLTVSFDIALSDGTRLTDSRHSGLRSQIYDFICVQAIPPPDAKRTRSPDSERRQVLHALHIVDYFLLREQETGFGQFGFAGLSTPHANDLLETLACSSNLVDSLYGWKDRLANFVRRRGAQLENSDLESLCEEFPALLQIPVPDTEWQLGLSRDELVRARAYLYTSGRYLSRKSGAGSYVYAGSTIAKELYRNTLCASAITQGWTTFMELCIGDASGYGRELRGVPVRTGYGDNRCNERLFETYRKKLLSFATLTSIGLGLPEATLTAFREARLDRFSLKALGRTRSVPPHVVARILSAAISFFYDHGEHLLHSLARTLEAAQQRGLQPAELDSRDSLNAFLHEGTVALGVQVWALGHGRDSAARTDSEHTYARRLRNQRLGLLDMCRCLFGSMQLIVGTLLAPRHGEVVDLTPNSLDQTGEWLELLTRKSGFDGIRSADFRPIPKVGADVIRLAGAFVNGKVTRSNRNALAPPTLYGTFSTQEVAFVACIDQFLDYIEAPVDTNGCRYYVRQHQLRGFLPRMFLYSSTVPAFDTMRWMLRHKNPKDLWNYISDASTGSVLQASKADVAAYMVREHLPGAEKLAALLQRHLGVSTLDVMDQEELEEYVRDLMEDRRVTVEPLFVVTPEGCQVRMGIFVREV